MSRHARAIRFIETYCRPSKGRGHGQPLRLSGFQREFLEAALADDIDIAVLQTPRGNGKSTLGGALATWAVFDDDATGSPQVPQTRGLLVSPRGIM
jgi:phage terminase large subunit-like protein